MVSLKAILIFGVGIFSIFFYGILALTAEDIFLLKYHQKAYKLRDLRAEVARVNKKVFDRFEIKTFKFNRTVTAFNITIATNYDFTNKLDMVVQVYKRASNEYRLFPIRLRHNFCKYFHNNILGLREMMRSGNLTDGCEWKKGVVYFVPNFVVDETKLPPLIPNGEFKEEVTLIFEDEEVAVVNAYAEIYLPIEIPKK